MSLAVPGQTPLSSAGYESNVFPGKQDQMDQVGKMIKEKGFIPEALVDSETTWFYKYVPQFTFFSIVLVLAQAETNHIILFILLFSPFPFKIIQK